MMIVMLQMNLHEHFRDSATLRQKNMYFALVTLWLLILPQVSQAGIF